MVSNVAPQASIAGVTVGLVVLLVSVEIGSQPLQAVGGTIALLSVMVLAAHLSRLEEPERT